MTTYVLAGGCFWCLDAVYRKIKGVTAVVSGYTAGQTVNPSYEHVCTGETGHTEAVKITFDESVIPSNIILDIFFVIHDPTTLNRQGADVGTQYRSGMYYADSDQNIAFEAARDRAQQKWDTPIVTEIKKLDTFYDAEAYHQDYFAHNPCNGYCSIVITPKIIKARRAYASWFQDS